LAFMMKTFLVAVPLLSLLPYLFIKRNLFLTKFFWLGLLIGFIPFLIWTISINQYLDQNIIFYLFEKFNILSNKNNFSNPFYYYFWNIPITFLPWSIFSIIGIIFFSLTFTIKQVVGLVIAFFGGILLLYNGGISPNYNVYFSIFIFFTTVGYGASVNLIKTYLTEISPSAVTAGIFLSILPPAVLVLFYSDFFVLKFGQSNIYESIIFVFLLALFSSAIAQTLFNRFVKLASPLFASAVTYLMPIVAIFWGVIDGEVLSLKQYVATVIILSGVYLVNNKQKTN